MEGNSHFQEVSDGWKRGRGSPSAHQLMGSSRNSARMLLGGGRGTGGRTGGGGTGDGWSDRWRNRGNGRRTVTSHICGSQSAPSDLYVSNSVRKVADVPTDVEGSCGVLTWVH